MAKTPFVARSRELGVLDKLWRSDNASLLILYGRRRVGKTRLLTHWLQQHDAAGLYWVAEPTSALSQLRSFSQALMTFIDPEAPLSPDFTFDTWEMALRQVALFAQTRRIALFIDEVTYLMDVNADFVGVLQKAWDQWLSNSDLLLALSGSQMGLMQKHLLDYEAPLYGRLTAQMKLPPLPFGTTRLYFPDYSARERATVFAMWGGVPAYWERLDPEQTVLDNLQLNILPDHAWMIDESRILLQDFITDLHNYVGIMRAVADGQHALGEIADRIGLSGSKASFYLSVLRDTGFVTRRVPISQRGTTSRRGRYYVTDPYLRFFYRFMSAHQSRLALGQTQQMMQLLTEDLPDFIEAYTWQELCRDWLLYASDRGEIPLVIDEVGSEWTRSRGIDVVGINEKARSVVLGDCVWRDEPAGLAEIEGLLEKTSMLAKPGEDWTVYYALFSAAGWTDEARAKAEKLATKNAKKRGGQKWTPAGIRLVDLAEVDADLSKWSV